MNARSSKVVKYKPTYQCVRHRNLLRWAIRYVERDVEQLVSSYSDRRGKILDAEVRDDVDEARKWLAQAKAAL